MRRLPYKFIISALILAALILWNRTPPLANLKQFPLRFFVSLAPEPRPQEEVEEESEILKFKIRVLEEENASLRKALGFKEKTNLALREAYILGKLKEFGGEYFFLNRGKEAGFQAGDWVVTETGLLFGKVVEVEDDFSKVSLASNRSESFEVSVLPGGLEGVARGLGSRAFSFEFLPEEYPLRAGDSVFASVGSAGSGAPFLLGSVNKISRKPGSLFAEAEGILASRPEFLRRVFVTPAFTPKP